MPLQRTVAPAKLPVTAAFVKAHTRIDTSADDSYLNNLLIPAAVDLAEMYLRRSLITQTWVLTLDGFPGPSMLGIPYGVDYIALPGHAIVLEKPPVQQISSIVYTAYDQSVQTFPLANVVDPTYGGTVRVDGLARITPLYGQVWPPNVAPQIGAVRVTYVAGYGGDDTTGVNGEPVPAAIKQWIAMNVATMYENRERCVVGTRVTVSELPYVDRLMDPYIVPLP